MGREIKIALALVGIGTAGSLGVLAKTTALTLVFWGAVAVPCFFLGGILYAVVVVKDLKRHKVL